MKAIWDTLVPKPSEAVTLHFDAIMEDLLTVDPVPPPSTRYAAASFPLSFPDPTYIDVSVFRTLQSVTGRVWRDRHSAAGAARDLIQMRKFEQV